MVAERTPSTKILDALKETRNRIAGWAGSLEALITAHPVAFSVAGTLGMFALFWWKLTPRFNTNDDVHLMWITDGTFFHDPVEHLIISNVAMGKVITWFYNVWPSVGWYPLWLYAVHVLAFGVFLYVLLSDRRFKLVSHTVAGIGFFGLFYLWTWMNLQFTSVSLMLGVGALVLYAAKAPLEKTSMWLVAFAGLMLGYVSLIRMESFQGTLALSAPIILFTFRRVPWRRQAVFAGVAGFLFLFGIAFEQIYYSGDDQWQAYREFNQIRGDIHATPRLVGIGNDFELLNAAGWSKNDLTMFRSWFFMDADVYTTEALDAIRERTNWARADISDGFDDVRRDRWNGPRFVFLGALFVSAMVAGGWRRRADAVITTLWTLLVATYLVAFVRLPDRVAVPFLAFLGLTYFFLPHEETTEGEYGVAGAPPWRRWLEVGAVGLLIVAVLLTVPRTLGWTRDFSHDNVVQQAGFASLIDNLWDINPNGVFVTLGPALRSQRVPPKDAQMDIPVHFIHMGWQARSPVHVEHMRDDHGIENLYEAIGLDDDVYFVTSTSRVDDSLYRNYMAEHYAWVGRLRPVARLDFGGAVTLWNGFVNYRIDDDALVELKPDGTSRRLVIDDDGRFGAVTNVPVYTEGGELRGWAMDLAERRPADLIVVMTDGTLDRLAIPFQRREGIAADLGILQAERWGFGIDIKAGKRNPSEVRVFAVFGDSAIELDLGSDADAFAGAAAYRAAEDAAAEAAAAETAGSE